MCKAIGRKLKTSVKKIEEVLCKVRKRYIGDAIQLMNESKKKPAVFIRKTIENAAHHGAMHKDMDKDFLFVKIAYTSIDKGLRHIRYHAKGRSGRVRRPRTTLTIWLEELSPKDFYKEVIMKGKFPFTLAEKLRYMLLETDADY